MAADPEPDQVIAVADAESPKMQADAHRPEPAGLLEMQRGMMRVYLQSSEVAVGKIADCLGELFISLPEFRRGE